MKKLSAPGARFSNRHSHGRLARATITAAQELDTDRPRVVLDGVWEFSYDPRDIGVKRRWFDGRVVLAEKTRVPGTPHAERHPSAGPAAKVTWLPPTHRNRKGFEGKTDPAALQAGLKYPSLAPAWHRRRFKLPSSWRGEPIWLHLGGVTPAADVWLNGTSLGSTLSSRTPLRCDVSKLARFDEENVLAVRIHWPPGPRLDGIWEAGEFSPFAGIYRSAWIEPAAPLHICGIHVVPSIRPSSAQVRLELSERSAGPDLRVRCTIEGEDGLTFVAEQPLPANREAASLKLKMPGAKLWSPEQPALYRATVQLFTADRITDTASMRFGLRDIRALGTKVLLNGNPVMLRGGCDDHYYPECIAPPASKEYFLKRLRLSREYGFNYTKSCVELFTQEFLEAADEVGLMVCQEMPFGLSGKYRVDAREKALPRFPELWRRELRNIIRADRNHPCVIAYSMCSELGTVSQSKKSFALFSREFPKTARKLNPRALAIDITHGGEEDFSTDTRYGPRDTDLYVQCVHGQHRLEPLHPPLRTDDPQLRKLKLPWILHEYAWWTQLPDPKSIPRYKTLPQKLNGPPETLENSRNAGLAKLVPTMVANSRKMKHLLRKEGLELARRYRQTAGYHLWLVHDFSYAPEGVFNEFWDRPDDLSAEEFRACNDDTVLLLDDGNRRCFTAGAEAPLSVQVSHFGPDTLSQPVLTWRLVGAGQPIAEGELRLPRMRPGELTAPARLHIELPKTDAPQTLDLQVELRSMAQRIARNAWRIWSFPRIETRVSSRIVTDIPELQEALGLARLQDEPPNDATCIIVSQLRRPLLRFLEKGGCVILLSEGALKDYRPAGDAFGDVFRDIYRTVPWNNGAHGNMGTIVADHPSLRDFPHDGWCELNFVHLIAGVYPLMLDPYYPARIDPIIRSIGHHRSMADKAYLFEAAVGKGALLATSLKIRGTFDSHIETRYLMQCLLAYATGSDFKPKRRIDASKLAAAVTGLD